MSTDPYSEITPENALETYRESFGDEAAANSLLQKIVDEDNAKEGGKK